MTFTPGCPFDGQSLLSSKPQVRGNFTSLFNSIDENHYPPNDPLDGKHRKSQYPEQAPPYPSTVVNECVTFSQEFNGKTELMYRPENTGAAGDAWALSGFPFRAFGAFDSAGNLIGASFNCSITKVSGSNYTVTFLTQFPIGAPSANYVILANCQKGTSQVDIVFTNILAASFGINIPALGSANPTYTSFIVLGG